MPSRVFGLLVTQFLLNSIAADRWSGAVTVTPDGEAPLVILWTPVGASVWL